MPSCCPCCSRERDAFICTTCLNKLLKLYKNQTSSHTSLLPAAEARAKNGIRIVEGNRTREAVYQSGKDRCTAVKQTLNSLEAGIAETTQVLQNRRHHLAERRKRLQHAKAALSEAAHTEATSKASPIELWSVPLLSSQHNDQQELERHIQGLHQELAETRRILLRELMEALDVKLCDTSSSQYQIASMPVPSLPDLLRMSKNEINAILAILIRFIRLASQYLGIQLPFTFEGTGLKPLVRASSMSSEAVRYNKAYPLYLSSGSKPVAASEGVSGTGSSIAQRQTGASLRHGSGTSRHSATASSHAQALETGAKMLAYNAFYLLQTCQHSSAEELKAETLIGNADIVEYLVRLSEHASCGQQSHILSTRQHTLRNLEPLIRGGDFASFSKAVDALKDRRAGGSQAVQAGDRKRGGKYVVVQPSAGAGDGVQRAGLDTTKDEEDWSIV